MSRTQALEAALRKKYAPPAWGLLFEVANATGSMQLRRADAVAMSLWPSRGLEVHGFELKADRRDWVRELERPEKAEPVAAYCDRWWLVTADEKIVKEGELPSGWGLLTLGGGEALRVVKEAPAQEVKPVTRGFLAAVFRRATESVGEPEERVKARELAARDQGFREGFKSAEVRATRAETALRELEDRFSPLLWRKRPEDIALAVRFLALLNTPGTLSRLRESAERNRDALSAAASKAEELVSALSDAAQLSSEDAAALVALAADSTAAGVRSEST